MKKLAFLVIFLIAAAGRLQAAEAPAAARSKPVETPSLTTKNKSSFTLDAGTRNPFWPIGWKPTAKLADPGAEQGGADIPVTAFVISSITIESSGRFAIINGKIMQEGQQFGLQLGNQTYQITVKSIQDGRVTLARRDQEIVVPLRRK